MPKPDPQDERMALADKIEAWLAGSFYKPGDMPSSSMQASIGGLVCQHMPMILAALRAQPERAAADMRERVVEQPFHPGRWINGDGFSCPTKEEAIRALPLSPAGEGGGE
jgi:hypothetical protein